MRASSHAQFSLTGKRNQFTLMHMLESVGVTSHGMRHTTAPTTASTFLGYKNAHKCRLLLNAMRMNASDPHPSKKGISQQ